MEAEKMIINCEECGIEFEATDEDDILCRGCYTNELLEHRIIVYES